MTGSSVLSKWFGESESNVRRLFAEARRLAPAVIFIDEVDSLLGRRAGGAAGGGDGPGGASEASRRVTNELLAFIDGIHSAPAAAGAGAGAAASSSSASSSARGGGDAAAGAAATPPRVVVVAATNAPWDLDEAALSRFAARVLVPLPDAAARAGIARGAMAGVACDMQEADWRRVAEATAGYSGRDLMQVCREASMRPLRELWGGRVLEGGAAPRHAARQRQLTRAVAAALARGVSRRRMRRELERWKKAEAGAAAWCDVDAVIADAMAANAAEGEKGKQAPSQAAPPSTPPPQQQQQQDDGEHTQQQDGQQHAAEPSASEDASAATTAAAAATTSAATASQSSSPPPPPPDSSAWSDAASSAEPSCHSGAAAGLGKRSRGADGGGSTADSAGTWTIDELLALPADALRPVTLADFEAAAAAVGPAEGELAGKFEEWAAKHGSGCGPRRRGEAAWREMPMYL